MSTPSPESPGLPLRALAMVLLSAAIVFAGLGWIGLSDSDNDTGAAEATTAPTPTAASPATTAANPTSVTGDGPTPTSAASSTGASAAPSTSANSAAVQNVPVRVYNNSTVDGLASTTADKLREEGWTVTDSANYDEGQVPRSAVYYGTGAGEKEAAEKIAQDLGIVAEPRFDGIVDAPPGVIVILAGESAN